MATKARQQYFADEHSLSKEKREFSIADEIQQKIDSIEEGAQVNKIETVKVNGTALVPDAYKAVDIDVPDVIDNLYTVDSDNALSAKQGKLLYDYIQNIASRGRFLSNWNSATGLPMTNPEESPYPYKSGDYFNVSNVAGLGGTNYRPDGSSYIIGQASTVVETEDVNVSDFYFYDGTNWLLLSNSGRQIAVDSSLSTTSTNPVENRVITNALNGKQETLIAGSNIQIAADGKTISATDTTYSAGANISIDANNEISAVDTTYTAGTNVQISNQNVISATDTKYSAGTGINIDANNVISNTQTSAEWGNITGTLSNQTDLQSVLDEKQDVLTAGTNISISPIMESDMKGPCSSGFHVPLQSEWNNVITAYRQFGLNDSNFYIYFKIAKAGYYVPSPESGQDGSYRSAKGSSAYLWTNTVFNSTVACVNVGTRPATNLYLSRCYGCNIRAFANTAIAPDSSWTTLYDGSSTATGAGIFHNSTLGVISISSDGTTWYTMADKNVGATAIYNDGDTRSQSNCGCIFQWGNNYMFSYTTGRLSPKSLSKVDASGYGPGNYYSSDTFIVVANQDWSSVQNDDLWGADNPGTFADGTEISATDTTYTAGDGISIDANNEISNTLPGPTIAATAPTGTEGALWYDTTNNVLMAHDGTAWKEAGTQMKVLSYGHSTWQDFLDAYNENAIVYCRASSNSNPGSGVQGRMAFMAFVSLNSSTGVPQNVEFQYYRSRSDHNTQANQLDEVYVYKLESNGTWAVTQRNTGAKAVAGAGINLAFGSGNMTISADTTTLATKTDLNSKQDTLVSGTNIKTVNSNSLLGSGDIALNDVKVSATAPASPTEGMAWYDTTNDQLKVYDGTNWNVTGKEYSAGEGISIGSVVINGRQGPAPEGFHVPSVDEWAGLKDIMDNVSLSSGNDWKTNLYMPFSGHRYDDGSIDVQGTEGYYWSSTPLSGTGMIDESSYNLLIATTGNAKPREYNIRSYGLSIRCFKDTPVEIENPLTPGGDWDLITNVGLGFYIFHSPSLGVITIMNHNSGREYITIADKNLGATTVYNDGDTLSEANCGKYYQWGNNYGFPWTGAITTSGTQVDASGYGPGNYYSSDTFITGYADWSSVRNPNLWGDTTGTITQDNVIKNTGVLSVNGQTGDITIETFQLAPNSPLNPKYRRYGTQAQYEALAQYYTDEPGDTVYFTI